jgi:phenylacetate-CoA ligase
LIPATRQRIESSWGARVFDHYGLTEVGPVAVEPANQPGSLLILDNYMAEVIDPKTTEPTPDGEVGELVLTNLTRLDCPIARYRTGDLVKAKPTPLGLRLEGGILGRADDMIHIRGNNIYPAALESLVRGFADLAEFQIEIDASSALNELRVTVEPVPGKDGQKLAAQIAEAMQNQWLFRPVVVSVTPGTLPRFEMKARRIHRKS